ncbi:MAG: hypothetical protein JSV76_05385 [Candidatus Bathyarchaeota archaeon]|nr:MAG: hypothetical protein JSV76_05385 [Candidatus Bathyarchaeota archaeon]
MAKTMRNWIWIIILFTYTAILALVSSIDTLSIPEIITIPFYIFIPGYIFQTLFSITDEFLEQFFVSIALSLTLFSGIRAVTSTLAYFFRFLFPPTTLILILFSMIMLIIQISLDIRREFKSYSNQ